MGMQPRIASSARLAAIPIPNRGPSRIADGLQVAAQTFGAIDQSNHQTDLQVDAMNHALEMKKQDAADQQLALQQSAAWAQAQSKIERRIADERQTAQVGAVEHTNNAKTIMQEELTAFDAGFGQNERVRQRFTTSIAETSARLETRETLWESDQYAKAQGDAAEKYLSTVGNSLLQNPDLKATEEAMTHWRDVIVANFNGNDDLKAKLLRSGQQQIMGSMIDGRLQAGKFEEVNALIKSGALNDVFDDVEPYMRKVDNERRAAAAAVEAEQVKARDDIRKGIDLVEEMRARGDVPDAAMIEDLYKRGAASGLDPAELYSLRADGFIDSVNRQFGPENDPDGGKARAMIKTLAPKIAAGKANADEEILYKQLTTVLDRQADKFGSSLSKTAATGLGGQMEVLGQIDGMSPDERFTAGQSAGKNLGYVSLVPKQSRGAVLKGMEDMATPGQKILDIKKADGAFRGRMNSIGIGLSEDGMQSYKQVANGYYAYYAKQQGLSADEFSSQIYESAVRVAFGGERRPGPDGKLAWYGGAGMIGKTPVLLPNHMTDKMFETTIYRQPYNDAYVSGDVKTTKADVLENFVPVWVGKSGAADRYDYRHKVSGRWLKNKDGTSNYRILIPPGAK